MTSPRGLARSLRARVRTRTWLRRYHLDHYKLWFPRTGRVFRRYLERHEAALVPGGGADAGPATIAIVVVPWVSTPVPWYAVMLAFGLRRRGRDIVFLWDDTGFPELHLDEQRDEIAPVMQWLRRVAPVLQLSALATGPADGPSDGPGDDPILDRMADQNLTWILRGAPNTEADPDGRHAAEIRAALGRSLPQIQAALDDPRCEALDSLVVPGGVYGTSGLFDHEARRRGLRVATFDTDRRIAQICSDGVAAQHRDVPTAFDVAWERGGASVRHGIDVAKAEFQTRVENRDAYGFQTTAAAEGGAPSGPAASDGGVLIPLNVVWDTAALGRHIHFDDTVDWVLSTVEAILEHGDGPAIVRQHPSERRRLQRSRLDIGSALRERFGDDPRCRFIAADDPVSSYDLLQSARLVLPFVSTIAIEAAAMGKPVLISGDCYFADLGFVWSATSRAEYFEILRRGLDGTLGVRPEQVDRAWFCYYLSAVQNRIPTDFTPHPDDYWTWTKIPPDTLFADTAVSDIVEALDRGVPVALLQHERQSERADRSPA